MFDVFHSPNEVTALLAVVCMGASAWGLRGTFRESNDHPHGWLARAIVIAIWVVMLRLTMWDVVIAWVSWYDPSMSEVARYIGNWVNGLFNLSMVACAYCIERAILLSIPVGERDRWSIWTAWLYPYHLFTRGRK